MDKKQLAEETINTAANGGNDAPLTSTDVERVFDLLFGTVEHPGSIAEALNRRENVSLGSFGSFRTDGGTATFRPGTALTEFLQNKTG
ncbi:HU family DNA-binding protein [Streptomyces coelicoflavus]|uniref:HU family DNA-binding protein n=1 Tax=Streptomyces coelicoflavus TaxID=285562 RepID=A0A6N9UEE8_9ACTN|nr:HU family DNA-binding protein [Streptomyces coelicoflavus]NEB14949.1 HU family DNA-binding protein [Streptomyces coelicoflavus]